MTPAQLAAGILEAIQGQIASWNMPYGPSEEERASMDRFNEGVSAAAEAVLQYCWDQGVDVTCEEKP